RAHVGRLLGAVAPVLGVFIHRHQQLLAGGEVVQQRAVRDPDGLGDAAQGGAVGAALTEHLDGAIEDLLPAGDALGVGAGAADAARGGRGGLDLGVVSAHDPHGTSKTSIRWDWCYAVAHASRAMRPALTTTYESRSPVALPLASVHMYTLATECSADLNGSLDKLAKIGLKNVEAFDFVRRPQDIRAALDASGLGSPTGHAPLLSDELWTPDGSIPTPSNEVVFEAAAEIGMKTVIDPMVPTERWLTEDGVKDIAERLNAASEKAKEFGLTVGYHNHAQEFLADFDGKTAYQRFLSLVDPSVAIELDLYWALVGGQDVVALVEELGDRLVAIHVKDGIKPETNPFAPGAPK